MTFPVLVAGCGTVSAEQPERALIRIAAPARASAGSLAEPAPSSPASELAAAAEQPAGPPQPAAEARNEGQVHGCGAPASGAADPLAPAAADPPATTAPASSNLRSKEIACSPGRLEPVQIQQVIRRHLHELHSCYEQSLRSCPSLQGKVQVKFVIAPDGSVADAQEQGSTELSPAVVKCVVKVFSEMVFPQPVGGCVTVTYPILFSPGG